MNVKEREKNLISIVIIIKIVIFFKKKHVPLFLCSVFVCINVECCVALLVCLCMYVGILCIWFWYQRTEHFPQPPLWNSYIFKVIIFYIIFIIITILEHFNNYSEGIHIIRKAFWLDITTTVTALIMYIGTSLLLLLLPEEWRLLLIIHSYVRL